LNITSNKYWVKYIFHPLSFKV